MSNHTPGPWMPACTCNSATHRHPAILSDSGQVAIATFQGSEPATDANARLIAAAPDLLDALLSALPFVEDAADDEIYKSHRVHKVLKEIRAAIEKAGAK